MYGFLAQNSEIRKGMGRDRRVSVCREEKEMISDPKFPQISFNSEFKETKSPDEISYMYKRKSYIDTNLEG